MRVNEIFYSIQGEGHFTGTPAVFVRLSGCNLKCSFCDTNHLPHREMTEDEILAEALRYPARHVVLTGGEPTMQVNARLTSLLRSHGFFIQMETNGSMPLPEGCEIDWVTCSPKDAPIRLAHIDELKVLFKGSGTNLEDYLQIPARDYRLQPLDTQDTNKNNEIIQATLDYILKHPTWKLSLQTHKILNVR